MVTLYRYLNKMRHCIFEKHQIQEPSSDSIVVHSHVLTQLLIQEI